MRTLIVGLVVLLLGLVAAPPLLSDDESTATRRVPVSIDAPAYATVGEIVPVFLVSSAGDGVAIVVVRSAVSTHRFTVHVRDGGARIDLHGAVVEQAGTLEIRTRTASARVELQPGTPEADFQVLAGPHTVVADRADLAMAVAIPLDRLGNPVAAGTEVAFDWHQPGGDRSVEAAETRRGLAFVLRSSGARAGVTEVGGRIGSDPGLPARLFEVPGPAVAVTMAAIDRTQPEPDIAIELQTEPIVDRFGNELPDGIEGHFRVVTSTGDHVVPGVIQDARLRAWWVPAPGLVSIAATVNGVVSAPISSSPLVAGR